MSDIFLFDNGNFKRPDATGATGKDGVGLPIYPWHETNDALIGEGEDLDEGLNDPDLLEGDDTWLLEDIGADWEDWSAEED